MKKSKDKKIDICGAKCPANSFLFCMLPAIISSSYIYIITMIKRIQTIYTFAIEGESEAIMYEFRLPEDIHGYQLPRTIEEAKRYNSFLVSYIGNNICRPTMTNEEAAKVLKEYNPEGLYKGFFGNNPVKLTNCVRQWFKRKMKEVGIDQRTFRGKLGFLEDVVVDPRDVRIISTIYDPHTDQQLTELIKNKKEEYGIAQLEGKHSLKANELMKEISALEEQFNAEPYEVKEAIIPAGTVIKININVPEMIKTVIQKRERQLNRAFGL